MEGNVGGVGTDKKITRPPHKKRVKRKRQSRRSDAAMWGNTQRERSRAASNSKKKRFNAGVGTAVRLPRLQQTALPSSMYGTQGSLLFRDYFRFLCFSLALPSLSSTCFARTLSLSLRLHCFLHGSRATRRTVAIPPQEGREGLPVHHRRATAQMNDAQQNRSSEKNTETREKQHELLRSRSIPQLHSASSSVDEQCEVCCVLV